MIYTLNKKLLSIIFKTKNFLPYFYFYDGCLSNSCSNSSADRRRNAAASLYPVINCFTAAASVTFKSCGKSGRLTDKSVGPKFNYLFIHLSKGLKLKKYFYLEWLLNLSLDCCKMMVNYFSVKTLVQNHSL